MSTYTSKVDVHVKVQVHTDINVNNNIDLDVDSTVDNWDEIETKIKEDGFEKTALLYSMSNTSNTGGKIGWINQNQLSKKILAISPVPQATSTNFLLDEGFIILIRLFFHRR